MSAFSFSAQDVQMFVSREFPELSEKEAQELEYQIRVVQLELQRKVEELLLEEREIEEEALEAGADPHGQYLSSARRGEWRDASLKLVSRGNGRFKALSGNSGYERLSFWSDPKNSKNRSQWVRSGRAARRLTNRVRRQSGLI